uniref:Uncharacterized protein n=1 Tax=Lactuca sativa TaxID=4236 RepID=A0A9R1XV42_LACSA|nr:hypothetical protein LSAT_V11C100041360 [Lactuca sativa]
MDSFAVGGILEATCCGSAANPVNVALHHPHYKFLLLSMIQQTRQHLLLSYARKKDVLLNPTHVQITNPPTISTMEMVTQVPKIIIKKRDSKIILCPVVMLVDSFLLHVYIFPL